MLQKHAAGLPAECILLLSSWLQFSMLLSSLLQSSHYHIPCPIGCCCMS